MAATDSIGGTLLSTYGLRLAHMDGHLDLPAYKNIVEINDMDSSLRKTEEKKIRVKLIGNYASAAAMGFNVDEFKTKIKSAPKLVWVFTAHGFSETCFVKDPVKVQVYAMQNVEISLTLNVTEA